MVLTQGIHLINTYSTNLEVNRNARSERHKRIFSRTQSIALALSKVAGVFTAVPWAKKGNLIKHSISSIKPVSEAQMLKRALAFTALFVIVTSYTPNIAFSEADFAIEGSAAMMPSSIIADDSGFIMPVNPQTNEADRSGMTDKAIHTVQSGETLSTIAQLYGIKTSTLLWENGLSENSILKVGMQLAVPPVDGVSHIVKSGQSLDKIASLYSIDKSAIIAQNALIDETLAPGQAVFIPGGKLIVTTPVYDTPAYRSSSVARVESGTRIALDGTTAAPAVGKFLIYPTRGKITQGYRSGHLAVDIADASKPPIWAGSAGTVVKASSGTWGGGYGNHVIIDHGNGVKTLYAHMDYLTVSEGQYVNQGEVIGRMGNTGRVYGRTGIHLHFEVIVNGVKQNPGNYY